MNKRILFRCDADSLSGFGHFSRCLNLARHFSELSVTNTIFFIGIYNSFAKDVLTKYHIPFEEVIEDNRFNAKVLSEKAVAFDYVIFDSYLFTQSYIDTVNICTYKTIYISDTSELNYDNADLVVNFRMEGYKHSYKKKNTLLGIDYFITKPEFREIREKNKQRQVGEIKNILLFNSGTSTKDKISYTFLKIIDDIFSNIQVNLISKDIENLSNFHLSKNEYILHKPTFEIEKYYRQADVILSGGGLTKYESSYCLIPNAATSNTLLQHEDSVILHENGLCYDLGYINTPNTLMNLEKKLSYFLTNVDEQKKICRSGMSYFNTKSTFNLCQKILEL